MNGIVVPIDGSRAAAEALVLAEAVATPRQLRILLLEVVWKPGEWSQRYAVPTGGLAVRDPESWGAETAQAHLSRVAAAHTGTFDIDVRPGPPVEAILRAVAEGSCSFICIAAHSQAHAGGLAALAARFGFSLPPARHVEQQAPWVLQHYVEDLVRRSTVPVLVVPVESGPHTPTDGA